MKKIALCLLLIPLNIQANILTDIKNETTALISKIPLLKSAISATESKYNEAAGKVNSIKRYFEEFGTKVNRVVHAVQKTAGEIKDQFVPAIERNIDDISNTNVQIESITSFMPVTFIDNVMMPINKVEDIILNISKSGLSVSNSSVAAGHLIQHFGEALEFIGVDDAKKKTKEINTTIGQINGIIHDVIQKEHEGIEATRTVKQELKFIADKIADTIQKFKEAGIFDAQKIKGKVQTIIQASGISDMRIDRHIDPPALINFS